MRVPRGSNKGGTHLRNSSQSGNEKWNKKVVATKHLLVFVHCWPPAICICMTQKNSYSDQYLETILIICVFAQSSNKEQIMVIQQECHILFLYSKSRQCRLLKYYVLISLWLAFGPWPVDGISISCQCRIKFFGVVCWLLIVIAFFFSLVPVIDLVSYTELN